MVEYETNSHPHGTYSVQLTLECGHVQYRKGSEYWPARQSAPVERVKCRECHEANSV